MKYLITILFSLTILFIGCLTLDNSGSDNDDQNSKIRDGNLNNPYLKLQRVQTCDELKEKMIEHAINMVAKDEEEENDIIYPKGGDVTVMADASAEQGSSAAGSYSTTNIQVEGVDEADIVKTNGDYLFVLRSDNPYYYDDQSNFNLIVYNVSSVPETSEVTRLAITGNPQEMFLFNNTIAVFSEVLRDSDETISGESEFPESTTNFTEINILEFDGDELTVTQSSQIEGSYISSRLIDENIHIVTSLNSKVDSLVYDLYDYEGGGEEEPVTDIDSVDSVSSPSYNPNPEKGQFLNFFKTIYPSEDDIRTAVNDADITDLIARFYPNKTDENVTYNCSDIHYEEDTSSTNMLTITSIKLSDLTLSNVSILGNSAEVYASTENIYLASANYDYFIGIEPLIMIESSVFKNQEDDTENINYSTIHKFDIKTDPSKADYVGSVEIKGELLNQFSMDEYGGYFRLATTVTNYDKDWLSSESNSVYVLDENLNLVGGVENIEEGEEIYSARFIGEKAYVVTFRQTDPLFTIDLSDPTNPTVEGALEISGFSSYIHPLDENHLLTIGQDSSVLKLDLYDVSDFENPSLVKRVEIDGDYSYSEALDNHKAFTLYNDILSIPISITQYSSYNYSTFVGFAVFHVTSDDIEEIGEIEHDDEAYEMRSVFIDDYLFTISNLGLKANEISTSEIGEEVFSEEF